MALDVPSDILEPDEASILYLEMMSVGSVQQNVRLPRYAQLVRTHINTKFKRPILLDRTLVPGTNIFVPLQRADMAEAHTLRQWIQAFQSSLPGIIRLGFGAHLTILERHAKLDLDSFLQQLLGDFERAVWQSQDSLNVSFVDSVKVWTATFERWQHGPATVGFGPPWQVWWTPRLTTTSWSCTVELPTSATRS